MSLTLHGPRLAQLSGILKPHIYAQLRYASAAPLNGYQPNGQSGSFPFPTHPRPTPHQIFHLPASATPKDIKARYYDLVRCHHPDSHNCRSLSPEERHARFQAITSAYDILRGKTTRTMNSTTGDPWRDEILRRKQFYQAHYSRRRAAQDEYDFIHPHREAWAASPDDRWKDRVIIVVGISLILAVAPGLILLPMHLEKRHQAAAMNLRQARSEAREVGAERRESVRKRVQEMKKRNEDDGASDV